MVVVPNGSQIASLHRSHRRFHYADVDLADSAALLGVLRGARPPIDLVMHFAAVAYVGEYVQRKFCRSSCACAHRVGCFD